MNNAISDNAANAFSRGFYQAIGEGNDIKFAFDIGLVNLSQVPDEQHIPELWLNGDLVATHKTK